MRFRQGQGAGNGEVTAPASDGLKHDPWARCEHVCSHDLARGVRVNDLLTRDGPNDHSLMLPYWWPRAAS